MWKLQNHSSYFGGHAQQLRVDFRANNSSWLCRGGRACQGVSVLHDPEFACFLQQQLQAHWAPSVKPYLFELACFVNISVYLLKSTLRELTGYDYNVLLSSLQVSLFCSAVNMHRYEHETLHSSLNNSRSMIKVTEITPGGLSSTSARALQRTWVFPGNTTQEFRSDYWTGNQRPQRFLRLVEMR